MARQRSPNYPALGLTEAIEKVRALFERERRTVVDSVAAVAAFGYNGLNGPARSTLSALRKYGLIEHSKNGVRVSDLAMRILHPEGQDEARQAVREAALRPDLFRELYESHAQASETALQSHLIRRGFSASGAQQVIAAFRDTLTIAKLPDSEYTPGKTTQEGEAMVGKAHDLALGETVGMADAAKGAKAESGGVLLLRVPYGSTSLNIRIDVAGEPLRKDHLVRVRKYLELAEADLEVKDDGSTEAERR